MAGTPAAAQTSYGREPMPDWMAPPSQPLPRMPPAAGVPATAPGPAMAGGGLQATGGEVLLSPERSPTDPLAPLARAAEIRPFGWELFAPGNNVARSFGINPDYVIAPGDRVQVSIWGSGQNLSELLTVDLQGNIFLPEVGPVRVAGQTNAQLNDTLTRALARVYTSQVRVYTNLMNTQPVGVYVTGAVYRPGRFSGERGDSLLYYISQAGGIDLKRGSFRDITVLRGGREIARADLYAFLLRGQLPHLDFRDDDTIVVGPQRPTLTATGEVRNAYRFEINQHVERGDQVLEMVQPQPRANRVTIRGVRDGQPHNAYVALEEFRAATVHDGDALVFQSDLVEETIFVSVAGQHAGPSYFAVPRGARLAQVLDMIAVDPYTADVASIYLRRRSVAERQQRALEMALDQLQRSVLTTPSISSSEAEVRVREAELVQRFVDRARSVTPEGRVVLASGNRPEDVQLEPEDVIVIPARSDIVLVSGEVQMPQTLLHRPGLAAGEYVAGSGGFTERADEGKLMVVRQNGSVEVGGAPDIRPGDHIMVLPDTESKGFAIFKDMIEIVYRIAVSSGVVIRLL